MRAVIQLVQKGQVEIDGNVTGSTDYGYVILLGVGDGDTQTDAELLASKILKLRIFPDENGKMNRSIQDIGGEALVISQFTLYANCMHGNRPDFLSAAKPQTAIPLYEYFVSLLRSSLTHVDTGRFGADMLVTLSNDGPVTILLESKDLKK